METLQAKVTSKGQVTLPKQLRKSLSIQTGDRLEFSVDSTHNIIIRKKRTPGSSAGCGKRFLKPGQDPVSIQQMDEAIRKTLTQKHSRVAGLS